MTLIIESSAQLEIADNEAIPALALGLVLASSVSPPRLSAISFAATSPVGACNWRSVAGIREMRGSRCTAATTDARSSSRRR
jgi:hypothetical protein